jgi:hypothetical protein
VPRAAVDRNVVVAEAERLRLRLLEYSAVSMLGNLMLHAAAAALQTGAYEFPQVEYAALIYWHELSDRGDCAVADGAAVEEISQSLNALFAAVQGYYRSEADRARTNGVPAELEYRLRSAGLGIRVPAYEVHQLRVLRGIFGPHAPGIRTQLGFDTEDVVACVDAVNEHSSRAVASFHTAAKSLDSQEAYDEHFAKAGVFLTFEPGQIAALARLPAATVSSVMDFLSLERGAPDENTLLPSPYSMLRQRPILAIGAGRYLVPSHALLMPAVQSRLEQALNPARTADAADGLWTRYEKLRGKWVEEESYRLLQAMMPGGKGTVGAYYSIPTGERVEGDVVYQVDDVVFLLEGKAGAFSPATLRGAPGSLSDDVTEIISKGHEQCARTEAYIRAGNNAFENADGSVALTLTGDVREFLRIVITLDNVGALSTASAALQRAGHLREYPTWTLSMTDMMIVADVLSLPGELRHYARSRNATMMLDHVLTVDETDYLGMYLLWNQTTIMEEMSDTVLLTGHIEQFDNYYVSRKVKNPPRQPIPEEVAELIYALAHLNAPLWSQAACDILELGSTTRGYLADELRSRKVDASTRLTDVTFGLGSSGYLTVVLRNDCEPVRLREQFVAAIASSPMRVSGKRLIIGYDPANRVATADYYERVDSRHFRAAPSLTWTPAIVGATS